MKKNIFYFLIFVLLTLFYFHRALLEGLLIAPGDGIYQNFPTRVFLGNELCQGHFPFWIPYEYLGLPFLGSTQGGILYPFNWLFIFPYHLEIYNGILLLHYALCGFFTFLYLRSLKISILPAILGGIVFTFGGYMQAHKGHNQMQNVATWMPLMFYIVEKFRQERKIQWLILGAVVFALQIVAGHIHTVVWSSIFVMIYIVYLSLFQVNKKPIRFFLLLLLPFLLGAIIAGPQLYAGKELSEFSSRESLTYKEFTFSSFPLSHLPLFLFPSFFGYGYGDLKMCSSFSMTEVNGFIGVFVLMIALLTIIIWQRSHTIIQYFSIILIFSFLLMLGENTIFYRLMYHVPLYNLFRIPARNVLIFDFSIVILFSIGMHNLINDKKHWRIGRISLLSSIIVCIVCMLICVYSYRHYLHSLPIDLKIGYCTVSDALQMIKFSNRSIYIPFIFIGFYTLWILVWNFTRLKRSLLAILSLVIFLESYSFGAFHDARWQTRQYLERFEPIIEPSKTLQRIVTIPYKRGNVLFSLAHKEFQLSGYDPLQIRDFYKLTGIRNNGTSTQWGHLIIQNSILSMLSTRYICIQHNKYSLRSLLENSYYASVPQEMVKNSDILDSHWINENATITSNGCFILGGLEGQLSMIKHSIMVKPNTIYQLSLEIKSDSSQDRSLIVDLYAGPEYDRLEQQRGFLPDEIRESYTKYYFYINTGELLQSEVYLRIFTSSHYPYEIRNVVFGEQHSIVLGDNNNITGNHIPDFAPRYRHLRRNREWIVYENLAALPRAYVVTRLQRADSITEIKQKINEGQFNPFSEACVGNDDYQKLKNIKFSPGSVQIDRFEVNEISLTANISGNHGLVILTDQYYPGWRAYIDGKETRIYKTNGIVRGIVVPSGHHKLIFRYGFLSSIFKLMNPDIWLE